MAWWTLIYFAGYPDNGALASVLVFVLLTLSISANEITFDSIDSDISAVEESYYRSKRREVIETVFLAFKCLDISCERDIASRAAKGDGGEGSDHHRSI